MEQKTEAPPPAFTYGAPTAGPPPGNLIALFYMHDISCLVHCGGNAMFIFRWSGGGGYGV